MGFSLVAEGLLRGRLPDAPWRDLVTSLGYSAGFLFVTLGRQQLFTETTLTASLPLFHDRRYARDVARFWIVVFIANIVGTLLFAWAAALPGLFPAELSAAFRDIGSRAAEGSFGIILTKGVAAGWLIALMVWLLPFAGTARVLVIIFVTYLIAGAQLAHVIAGSVETAHAAITGAIGWADYASFLLAAFLGNTIGGVLFVALLNHAQVKEELKSSRVC
jgi:formate-nitrite transporter family protein